MKRVIGHILFLPLVLPIALIIWATTGIIGNLTIWWIEWDEILKNHDSSSPS